MLEIGKVLWAACWAAAIFWPCAFMIGKMGWSAVIAIGIFIGIVGLIVLAVWVMICCIDLYYDWDYRYRQIRKKNQ